MLKLWRICSLLVAITTANACTNEPKQIDTNSTLDALVSKAITDQVFIEGGSYTMGDFGAVQNGQWLPYFPPTAERNKAHTVKLSSFSLSAYETTWQDFDTYNLIHNRPIVIKGLRQEFEREPYLQDIEDDYDIRKPARVTWQEAKDYCLWLAEETNIAFDLPTSAQWEFAARNRGDQKWVYPTHDGKATPNKDRRGGEGCGFWSMRCSVGTNLPPNPLGLYDMNGNAEEWVNDWYSESYYTESDGATNPLGPEEGTEKEIRSLELGPLSFSFSRVGSPAVLQDGSVALAGFRCAVQSPDPIR